MKLKNLFKGIHYEDEFNKKVELIRSSDLFDENWYYSEYPDVLEAHKDAARHYFVNGWKEGRNPGPKFDNDLYLAEHLECETCPLYDYEFKKQKLAYREKLKNISNYDLLSQSTYFNKEYYLKHYPSIKKKGKDPIEHYLKYGWKLGFNPSAKFNTNFYLEKNQDVKDGKINPLVHFIRYGIYEKRLPKEKNSVALWIYKILNRKFKDKSFEYILIAKSKYFNASWYLSEYPDVKKSGIDPVDHYLNIGWKEGKNPSLLFDTVKYMSMYMTANDNQINPLLYHEKYGKDAGFIVSRVGVVFPKEAMSFIYEKRVKKNTKYKKLAVFASFSADCVISDNVIFYLKELRKICDGIVFVADNPLFPDELNKIKKYIIAAIVKRHEEYDFGSYKRGIIWLMENNLLNNRNLLIICNDSCFGPICPLRNMMDTMKTRDCDFWGITKNIEYGEHIQSYFMCFKPQVFMSDCFKTFFSSVRHWESQKEVVQNYEVPLTSYLYDNGFTYDTYIPYPEDRKSYPRNISNNLTRIGEYLIKSHSPFIKIKYFCSDKWNLDLRKNTLNLIKELNTKVYEQIINHKNVVIDEQEESEKKPRRLICNLININRVAPDKLVILARCNVNSSGINLFLNGIKLPKNKNLNPNMEYLLEKNDARFCFWEIDEKLLNKFSNKLIAMYKEKIELKIDRNMLADTRLLNRENRFIRVVNNTAYIEKKYLFYLKVMLSPYYTIKDKILFLLCLFRRKKYVLFSELSGLANDNAFEIFQEYKKSNKDGFYFIGPELEQAITKIIDKKQLSIFNSLKHLWLLINAKKIVCSYGIYTFLHQSLRDVHYALLDYELIYYWHGISCDDKDSVIYRYLYGTPDLCCCCSIYEKKFFEQKCEYPLVEVTGAPRMDKWKKYRINNKQILIFLTWRRTIKNYHDLVTSDYLHEIKKILKCLRKEKYQKYEIIYCIYHHFYQTYKPFLVEMINKINPNVKIISNIENKKFNEYFATSKFFITDCSSALYDKGYQDNSITICYLPDNFTSGHFALNENFYNRQLGKIVHNTDELEEALELKEKTREMKLKQKQFFKFFDNNNSKRVSDKIKEFNHENYINK